ncbi:MAG: hypothetical protein M1826_002234 [Phylliscum demangeonii]|nr:MAG: hypothetical protein M1826_002234 [Phylliscum demangeonii]
MALLPKGARRHSTCWCWARRARPGRGRSGDDDDDGRRPSNTSTPSDYSQSSASSSTVTTTTTTAVPAPVTAAAAAHSHAHAHPRPRRQRWQQRLRVRLRVRAQQAEQAEPVKMLGLRAAMNIGFQTASDQTLYTWSKTLMPTSFGAAPWQMDLLDLYRRMILTGSAFCTPADLPPRRILSPRMARAAR